MEWIKTEYSLMKFFASKWYLHEQTKLKWWQFGKRKKLQRKFNELWNG